MVQNIGTDSKKECEEQMTIDEAIAHAREVALEQSSIATELSLAGTDASRYIKCAEEHEQIAEWLEELKKLRQCTNIENREYPYFNGFKEGKQVGYNKAIDDFVEKFIYKAVCEGCSGCCNCYEESRQSECEDYKAYIEIAEQLKAGGTDE